MRAIAISLALAAIAAVIGLVAAFAHGLRGWPLALFAAGTLVALAAPYVLEWACRTRPTSRD